MHVLRRNCLFSLRQIRRQATLSAAIILTLGVAIGANATVFSFVNALCGTYEFCRPYNFSGPGRPEEWKTTLATGSLFSVLACIAPAWRASRLDPAITLRQE